MPLACDSEFGFPTELHPSGSNSEPRGNRRGFSASALGLALVIAVGAMAAGAARAQQCSAPLGPCATCFTSILGARWCGAFPYRVDYYYAASIPSGSRIISAVEWAVAEWNFDTLYGNQIPIWFDNQGGNQLSIEKGSIDGPGGRLAEMRPIVGILGNFTSTAILFDSAEDWEHMPTNDIHQIALHELGHVLGLGHVPCSLPGCSNLLMYPCQNSNAVIDGSAHSSLQCIYGDLIESPCQSLFGRFVRAFLEQPDAITLVKGTCRGCAGSCWSGPQPEPVDATLAGLTYELAVSSNGGAYTTFATIDDSQWINNRYTRTFSESWSAATIRTTIRNGASLVDQVYSYPPVDIVVTTAVPEAEQGSSSIVFAKPNPSRGKVVLTSRARDVASIVICDAQGRVIRALDPHPLEYGGALEWDGRDAAGRAVGNGIYFVRVSTRGTQHSCRVVMAR